MSENKIKLGEYNKDDGIIRSQLFHNEKYAIIQPTFSFGHLNYRYEVLEMNN